MPAEQRVGRDDRGDLAQRLTAQPERPHGEPPPVVIGQTQTPPTQLPAQEAVLFDQVGERLPLAALQPAGQDQQQHLEGRGVDHERELISQPAVFAVHNRSIDLWDTTRFVSVFVGNGSLRICVSHGYRDRSANWGEG